MTPEQLRTEINNTINDVQLLLLKRVEGLPDDLKWMIHARVYSSLFGSFFKMSLTVCEQIMNEKVIPIRGKNDGLN